MSLEKFGLDRRAVLGTQAPLVLDSGAQLSPITMAYETYGTLNAEATNAVLLCHALTGDHYAANTHPVSGKPGWWDRYIGPGKLIDTDRYCVICPNVLGSCAGTTGPEAINPATGQPFNLDFPVITIADMVRAQALLVDYLGIDTLFSVIGGSMGGMQVLEWCALYPERVFSAAPIATTARHSAQNIAFHEVGRQAIVTDPQFHGGAYAQRGVKPEKGLSVARMAAHITYMSEAGLTEKFGRRLQERDGVSFGFDADFQIESYLRHQGISFVDRFDANAYLYITRAMDYLDIAARYDGSLAAAFKGLKARVCVLSFTSDWLYPTAESQYIVKALNAAGARVSFVELESDAGHDAFLVDTPDMVSVLDGFLTAAAKARGLTS